MYYPYFLSYMAAGFIISILVFLWALKGGQFKDQQRARFLPLADEPDTAPPAAVKRMGKIEAYALIFLAMAGLAATVALLLYSFMTQPNI